MKTLSETSIAVNDFVIIKVLLNERMKIGNLFLSGKFAEDNENMKLVKGLVISSGKEAEKKYGIKKDDIVLFDKHSIFGNTLFTRGTEVANSIVVTQAENVIVNLQGE